MFRFLIIAVFFAMTGCISLAEYFKTASPMLPNTASLPCCWQVHEKLAIEYQGEQFELSSVIAIHDNQLTIVILDPLGQRLFFIMQQGDHVQVEKSSLIKKDLPIEWLLIGVYFRYMPDDGWLFKGSHWHTKRDSEHTLLMQNNKAKVILYEPVVASNVSTQLQYPDLKLNISITTLFRQSLD